MLAGRATGIGTGFLKLYILVQLKRMVVEVLRLKGVFDPCFLFPFCSAKRACRDQLGYYLSNQVVDLATVRKLQWLLPSLV